MKLSIVLSTQPAQFEAVAYKGDFERNVARIAELGYDGVELAIRDPALIDQEAIVAVLEKHGLEVPAIGTGQAWGEEGLSFTSHIPAVREKAVQRILAHLPFAQRLGAQVIIGLIRGKTPEGLDREQVMSWLVSALRRCAEAAALRGVRLCLEPLNRYETDLINTVAEGLALLEQVGAPNLGLLLDTFHMNIEEPDMAESIRTAGERLFHFHVADSNRWHPGAGHIDFAHLLGVLKETGYEGFVSGEFLPRPDADTAAAQAIAHLRAVMPK